MKTLPRCIAPHRGFTLLEFVFAVFLLSIVAAIALPTLATETKGVKEQAQAAELAQIAHEAQTVAIGNGRTMPIAADLTSAIADIPSLSSPSGLQAAAPTLVYSTASALSASSGPGNVSADISTPTGLGLAMTTSDNTCVFALLTPTSLTYWWYTQNIGSSCNGTQALLGPHQTPPPTIP